MSRRHANVANLGEVPARGFEKGSHFALANRALGRATGAQAIGCSHYEVPPGRTAFPSHYHCANEESIYILEGSGTLRIGAEEISVGPGDYATFPAGPEYAHQADRRCDTCASLPSPGRTSSAIRIPARSAR